MVVFDVDLFLKAVSNRGTAVETRHIADWMECSVRHIQKGASKIGIPYMRTHGRKHYIWDEENLRGIAGWINRKSKVRDEKPQPKITRSKEPRGVKKKRGDIQPLPFKTIREYVIENFDPKEYSHDGRVKDIQNWAKENGVPSKQMRGRKYYILTDDLFESYRKSKKK